MELSVTRVSAGVRLVLTPDAGLPVENPYPLLLTLSAAQVEFLIPLTLSAAQVEFLIPLLQTAIKADRFHLTIEVGGIKDG